MSRYCSDAIAIAQVAAKSLLDQFYDVPYSVELSNQFLDAAERQLRHNENHQEVPKDCSSKAFDVPKVK